MTDTDTYVFAGEHAEHLASGARIAPGDLVSADALDLNDPGDARLIADGILVDPSAAASAAGDELDRLSREDLNVRALAAGVETPSELPNKAAVAAAIREKEILQ